MRDSAINPSGSFGSLADILRCQRHVRFTPKSGHSAVQPENMFCKKLARSPGIGDGPLTPQTVQLFVTET